MLEKALERAEWRGGHEMREAAAAAGNTVRGEEDAVCGLLKGGEGGGGQGTTRNSRNDDEGGKTNGASSSGTSLALEGAASETKKPFGHRVAQEHTHRQIHTHTRERKTLKEIHAQRVT